MTLRFSFSFAHHGRYSSFHRLLAFASPEDCPIDATCHWGRKLPGRWPERVEWRWLRMKERAAWNKAHDLGADTFHYLYPENTCFAGHDLKQDKRVMVSCHQPAEYVEKNYGTPVLSKLENALMAADAVAVLGPEEVPLYRELAPQARVAFVPHGIDADWFHCRPEKRETDRPQTVLTVGNWLRDYKTWAGVVALAAADHRKIRFRVLANPKIISEALELLPDEARGMVEPLAGISDAELRDLYWDSTALFLPLKAAMANNALLEAMACGLPVVTTDLPGTRAYAREAASYHEPGNPESAYHQLGELLDSPSAAERFSRDGRMEVEHSLAWPRIIERHDSLLRDI